MEEIIAHFKKMDWMLIISVFLLAGIGLVSLYSSSLGSGDFSNFEKQVIFLIAGFFIMVVMSFLDWRVFRESPYFVLVLYCICLLGLIGLFFFAPEIRGTRSWYKIGGISIDPIEFAKVVLLILLAKYFSMRHVEMYRIRHIILSGIYIFIPSILIFRQPNLGSVLILIALWMGILIISGIKLRHFLILALCLVLIFVLGWNFFLKDYQKERIMSFLDPIDPLGMSWNQNQAKIAIGSGGLLGQGFGKGSQTQYGFLPENQNDFIFSSISEEFGLVGVFILLLSFSLFMWRIMKISFSAENNFIRLFASGFIIIVISQIFINIGMNIGILPIIGISLPLVSYGGSGLLAIFIGLGVLQNIKIQS